MDSDFMKEFGLDRLPPDKRDEALAQIGRIIYQGVLIRALDRLSEQDQRDFERLLNDHPDDEQVLTDFLEHRVPDLDAIIQDEIAQFRSDAASIFRSRTEEGPSS